MVGAKFLNNTSIAPYWANSFRIAGGKDVVVRNNLLTDASANSGMHIGIYGKSGNALDSALIEGNVILRGGGWNSTNRHGIVVSSKIDEYSNVIFRNNIIKDSRRAGVFIDPTFHRLTFENNQIINPTTEGFLIDRGVTGTGTFTGNIISGLKAGQPEFKNQSPDTFKIISDSVAQQK
jgi:hypothetical protein